MGVTESSPWYPSRDWTGNWRDDQPVYFETPEFHRREVWCGRSGYVDWNAPIRGSTLERIEPLLRVLCTEGGTVCPSCLFAAAEIWSKPHIGQPWTGTLHVEV